MKSTLEIGTELTATKEAAKIVSHKKGIANISSALQKFSPSCFQVPICIVNLLLFLLYYSIWCYVIICMKNWLSSIIMNEIAKMKHDSWVEL